jgi:uncharacterized repeat protein (TIGR03833 family)
VTGLTIAETAEDRDPEEAINTNEGILEMNGQDRKEIRPGMEVEVVLKKDQSTGRLTRGIVKDLLTKSASHSRGIKVRLTDGQIGRVQRIIGAP